MEQSSIAFVIVLALIGVGAAVAVLGHPTAGVTVWDVLFATVVGAFLILYVRTLGWLAADSIDRASRAAVHRAGPD